MDAIKCVFIGPENIEEATRFSMVHFLQDEPLGQPERSADEAAKERFFAEYCQTTFSLGYSVMAIDTADNNRIVGVRANCVKYRDKPEETRIDDQIESSPLIQFIGWLKSRYNVFEKLDVDRYLYFCFLCVDRSYRGRNISARMLESTFDYMRREKIPVCYVIATSYYSQAIFQKLDFELVDSGDYADYMVDGKVVFQPAPIHQSWGLYIKWIQ